MHFFIQVVSFNDIALVQIFVGERGEGKGGRGGSKEKGEEEKWKKKKRKKKGMLYICKYTLSKRAGSKASRNIKFSLIGTKDSLLANGAVRSKIAR